MAGAGKPAVRPHLVEAVVFDMGGVVCGFHPQRRLAALSRLTGRPDGAIDAAVWGSGMDAAAERGEYQPAEAYDAVRERLGAAVAAADLRAAWAEAFVPNREITGLAGRVLLPTALFTNNGPLLDDCLTHELATVGTTFDRILLSWRLGAAKPEAVAFARATAALGVAEPSGVLFVDDSLENVRAAARHGWLAHHYRGPHHLAELLAAHGLLAEAEA